MSDVDAQRLALARHHVRRGQDIVAQQRALIERVRAAGRSSGREESLLSTFEDTLALFEDDLDSLSVRAALGRAGYVAGSAGAEAPADGEADESGPDAQVTANTASRAASPRLALGPHHASTPHGGSSALPSRPRPTGSRSKPS